MNNYKKPSTNIYFAADEADVTVNTLQNKCDDWFTSLVSNRYLDKIKRSWNAYYGVYFGESDELNFGGEQGELIQLAVNHYRNIAEIQLRLITANRPAFQARSVNTDSQSQVQATLANGLLEYYMREKRLEKYLKTAVEYAIVLGSGYVKMEWNSTAGEIYDYFKPEPRFPQGVIASKLDDETYVDEDGNMVEPLMNEDGDLIDESGRVLKDFPIYEGDVKFSNLSPLDVVFDSTKENSEDHDWVVCRTFKNKYDLAAKFPDLEEDIKGLETKSDTYKNKIFLTAMDETVDVPVYEFFHKRTESMPDGRYILYLTPDIILLDTPMPYRNLPVYRISPSDIIGTPYGYTSMFALLPIQDAVNSLYSTAFTNQSTYGVQNILNPIGNGVTATHLEGGSNFIQYDPQVGPPASLNLTQTPAEIFNFMKMLEQAMETISGINSVARGNPESSLKTGTALALVQSQALQFMSGLQQSYVQLVEDVGTGLIKLLQDFASVPRIAEISGLSNANKMKSFKNTDIDSISRVVVDVGNALAYTTAGRAQMADNLLQMGLIANPQQYFSIINSGRLEVMTEAVNDQLILVKTENERLLDNSTSVMAIDTDDHILHIREHRAILNDADRRIEDPSLVERTLAHINEHMNALRQADPDLLGILQQQPLGPAGGSPAAPQQPQEMQAGAEMAEMTQMPGAQPQEFNLPKPPVDPNTGQPFQPPKL